MKNEIQQDALDWVELYGVDERVGTQVGVADEKDGEEGVLTSRELGMNM